MKKILIIVFCFNLISCATSSKRSSESKGFFWDLFSSDVSRSDLIPEWAKNLDSECKKEFICALGADQDNSDLASKRALANLAKVFENQIQQEFRSTLTGEDDQSSEDASESITETTNVVLEGASVSKVDCVVHADDPNIKECYALARVSKSKLSGIIRKDIEEIDQKIKALLVEKSVSSLTKIEKLLTQRSPHERKLQFLGGAYFRAPISREELAQEKQRRQNELVLKLKVEGSDVDNFENLFLEAMSGNGFKFSSGSGVTHLIHMKVVTMKEHLKVQGFQKQNYKITVKVKNSSGENVSTVRFDYSESGRSLDQINSKVLDRFKTDLTDRLSELNIQ